MTTPPESTADVSARSAAIARWDDEGGAVRTSRSSETGGPMATSALTRLAVDEGPHNSDGLLLHGWDQSQQVTAFVGRKVMDEWLAGNRRGARRPSLFRHEYNALGKHNLAAIERIVRTKYDRGPSFNRQHPFVDVLLSDIAESGEVLLEETSSRP